MSFHVYLAKPGWKKTWQDNPITPAEWTAAVNATDALEKIVPPKKQSNHMALGTRLKRDGRQRLRWGQGFVNAEAPSEALITVMFMLAEILGAKVYSEKAKPYASVEDWKNRTKKYYTKREMRRAVRTREWWMRWVVFFITVVIATLTLLLLHRILPQW